MPISLSVRRFLERHVWTGVGILALFTTARMASITGWDDAFYVAQLTSAVSDRDLLLQDDLLAFPRPLGERLRSVTTVLDTGAVQNTFGIGFAVIHGIYSWPFIAASGPATTEPLRRTLAVGSLAILVLGALAMVRLCERWGFPPGVSRLGTGLALASGPLALYGTRSYLNSHLLSAVLATFVLLAFLRWMEQGLWHDALLTGLCSGLLAINRWQDGVLLLGLAPALVGWSRDRESRRPTLTAVALAAAGFSSVILLQLLAWHAQFSTWLFVPQGGGYINWAAPGLLPLLISPYHGALPWTPGLVVGLLLAPFLGSASEPPVVRRLRLGLTAALPLFVYLAATPRDWWGGDSYGPRRLATLTPIAALGIAALLSKLGPWSRAIFSAALLLWASITVSAYISGFDDLWLLLTGAPGLFSRLPHSAYAGFLWIDPWGPLHALKPGFTFSDKPDSLDRAIGALTCTATALLVTWAWNELRRSDRLQRAAVMGLAGWVFVCAAWLRFVVPSNDDWNLRWEAVVQGAIEPPTAKAFPPRVADAAHLVRAVRALKEGDDRGFEEHWSALQERGAFGIRERQLRWLARD